jgi:hypothetical protein
VLSFNYTVGENNTAPSGAKCYNTDGEFDGVCDNGVCLCEIAVSVADMGEVAGSGTVEFSMEIYITNPVCPTANLTFSDSVTLGLLDCGCSPVSDCNSTSTTTSVLFPVIALGLFLLLIAAGIFVSRRRHARYNAVDMR